MNLPDFAPLFDLAQGFPPVAVIGAFFPFLRKKEKEEATLSKAKLQTINAAAHNFLEVRGVENFKVYTIAYDNQPVVLIQAEPQKKLRFSNIIEIQIKKHIRDHFSTEVPAVFWRFKTDNTDVPGPEQADYEFEDHQRYPQDQGQEQIAALVHGSRENTGKVDEPIEQNSAYHLPPHLTICDMQVEEMDITMGEFDAFLKGASINEKKDEMK